VNNCYPQDSLLDRRVSSVEHYPNGKIKWSGQKDSVEIGEWVFFKPSGDTLAIGTFTNGYKTGKWHYIDYKKRRYTLDFGPSMCCKSYSLKVKRGKLYIIDSWFQQSHCRRVYKNGRFLKEYCI
jgi:antitoxin component YwqK of YwqJK toxin-antitoxin module